MKAKTNKEIETVVRVARLEQLQAEYADLEHKMDAIRNEATEILQGLQSRVQPFCFTPATSHAAAVRPGGRAPKTAKHRRLEDRLLISAGRAIKQARNERKSADEARSLGIGAATALAIRNGLDALPHEVVSTIDKIIKDRFNLV